MTSLYIHIPFCHKLCPYCDFTTIATKQIPESDYIDALLKELSHLSSTLDSSEKTLKTIFWGGGTPSFLSAEAIEQVHESVGQLFSIDWDSAEVTLEGNPNDITQEFVGGLQRAGVNRLSIGAQSASPKILKTLGREHSSKDIGLAVQNATEMGITNVSLDLIYGVPKQSLKGLEEDLEAFTAFPITHISCYSLTFEAGTPFFQAKKDGVLTPLQDKEVRVQYETIMRSLAEKGFHHYEISNFCKQGFSSAHNENYWSRGSYLGIGAGAHSFLSSSQLRWANIGSPNEYMKSIQNSGDGKAWSEEIKPTEAASEIILLSLRTKRGLTPQVQRELEELGAWSRLEPQLKTYIEENFFEQTSDSIRLTPEGFCIADSLIENLATSL